MGQMVAAQDKGRGIYGWSFNPSAFEPFRASEGGASAQKAAVNG